MTAERKARFCVHRHASLCKQSFSVVVCRPTLPGEVAFYF